MIDRKIDCPNGPDGPDVQQLCIEFLQKMAHLNDTSLNKLLFLMETGGTPWPRETCMNIINDYKDYYCSLYQDEIAMIRLQNSSLSLQELSDIFI